MYVDTTYPYYTYLISHNDSLAKQFLCIHSTRYLLQTTGIQTTGTETTGTHTTETQTTAMQIFAINLVTNFNLSGRIITAADMLACGEKE